MITCNNVSAPIYSLHDWTQIPWKKCQKTVQKLQARIVKAVQEKRWNKVKSLQPLLTPGFSSKALSLKHVTTNKGKRTAGVDGETWLHPTIRYQAILSLSQRGYKPSSPRRIYIPKPNGKKRPLSIPTMKHRAMKYLPFFGVGPSEDILKQK